MEKETGIEKLVEDRVSQTNSFVQRFKNKVLQTHEDFVWATETLRNIKKEQKVFIRDRDLILKPLKKLFEQGLQPLKEIEAILRQAIAVYEKQTESTHTELLLAAKNANEVEQAVDALAPRIEGTHKRQNWSWELVDETLIPDEYWKRELDVTRLNQEARSLKGELSIPGIRAVCRETLVVKS